MQRAIQIEPGSRFIAAWELGLRIGALLHPTPDMPPLLVTLQKKIADGEPNNVRIEELSDADVQCLRTTWKGIDIPDALNMTQEQWAQCRADRMRRGWALPAGGGSANDGSGGARIDDSDISPIWPLQYGA